MFSSPFVTVIIGTRPEAIKMAPLVKSFKLNEDLNVRVVLTGQHDEIVSEVLNLFKIDFDVNLKALKHNQTLTSLTKTLLTSLESEFSENRPSLVLVQGDTTTAFAAGLVAFYLKIPVAHVEAGLRTDNIYSPFPEEINRRMISQFASLHFAPTRKSEINLNNLGVKGKVIMTGNTVIDALHFIEKISPEFFLGEKFLKNKKLILATIHRRENWGENLIQILKGLEKILTHNPNCILVIPLHPNKIVREPIKDFFSNKKNVFLIEPLPYDQLISAMKASHIIISDSGGIQEEAPSLNKPVIVLRDTTERQEAIDAGTAKLVGTNSEKIFKLANNLLNIDEEYKNMSSVENPFGDGNASQRIVNECIKFLKNLN